MKLIVASASLFTVLGITTTAAAGVPAWCAAIGSERVDSSGYPKDALKDEDPRNTLRNLVARTCKPDGEDGPHQGEYEAARKRWSQRLDLVESDWADVAEYATLGQGERMNGEVRVNTLGQEVGIGESLKRAWSSFDALDQWAMISRDAGGSEDLSLDENYLTDALGSKLTETGRLAYIRRCIKGSRVAPVQWAMCQGDIAQLDLKKLSAELRANKAYKGYEKMRIRVELDELKPLLSAHADKVKKLTASDPGYAKVFELAAATRKEWEGREKSDAALLELATAMDDARATNSRRAFEGCEDKTWAAWKTAVGALPAKAFEGMHDDREKAKHFVDDAMGPIVSNPGAYLASIALATCATVGQDRNAKHDVLTRMLGESLERWPGFRGPRTATHTAILGAGISLDDRDAKLEYPDVHRNFGGRNGGFSGGGAGVIGKMKASGKTVNVEFKKQMVKQVQCAQVKYTNRVIQIRSNGDLVYQSTCVKNETVTVDKSDPPQTVNARYADGVKPGMFASIIEDVVTAVWAKPGAPLPTMVFGVKLK